MNFKIGSIISCNRNTHKFEVIGIAFHYSENGKMEFVITEILHDCFPVNKGDICTIPREHVDESFSLVEF